MQARGIGFLKAFGATIGLALLIGSVGCAKKDDEAAQMPAGSYDSMKQGASAKARAGYSPAENGAGGAGYSSGLDGTMSGAPMHYTARQPGAERSTVRQASLSVEVESLDKAEKPMRESIAAVGGYIDHLEGDNLAGEQPIMHLTIRVPEKSFDGILAGFEALGHRTQKSISASDLTEQILDAEAQLKQVQGHAGETGQIAYNAERIKQLQAEREQLAAKAAMSTIDLTLQQKPNAAMATAANASWGSDTWNSALSSAMGAFRVIGAVAIWLLVYSPIWGAVLAAWFFGLKAWKRHIGGPQAA